MTDAEYKVQTRAFRAAARLERDALLDRHRKELEALRLKHEGQRQSLDVARAAYVKEGRYSRSALGALVDLLTYNADGTPVEKHTKRTFTRAQVVDLAIRVRLPQDVIRDQIKALGWDVDTA